jgi:hypothetical protein
MILMRRAVIDNPLINFNFTICTPFPGSKLYNLIFEKGLMKTEEEYYDKYFYGKYRVGEWNQIVNLSDMKDDEVIEMYNRIWSEYKKVKREELGVKVQLFGMMCIAINKVFPFLPKPFLITLDKKRIGYFGVKV